MAYSSFAKKNGLLGKNETNKVTSAVKQGLKKNLNGMTNQSKDFSQKFVKKKTLRVVAFPTSKDEDCDTSTTALDNSQLDTSQTNHSAIKHTRVKTMISQTQLQRSDVPTFSSKKASALAGVSITVDSSIASSTYKANQKSNQSNRSQIGMGNHNQSVMS